jgi:hypothetical protein
VHDGVVSVATIDMSNIASGLPEIVLFEELVTDERLIRGAMPGDDIAEVVHYDALDAHWL